MSVGVYIRRPVYFQSFIKQLPIFGNATFSTSTTRDITLYQYKICPFCNKVKSLLDYASVPYQTVEVDPLSKGELKFSKDYKKVPIARIGNEIVTESGTIMKKIIESEALQEKMSTTSSDFLSPSAHKWAEWADKELAVLLYPNLVRSLSESRDALKYVYSVPNFTLTQKILSHNIGSFAMWLASGKLKKKYGIVDERRSLYDALDIWEKSALQNKQFAGGDLPNLGDVAVFGVIRSLEGLSLHTELLQSSKRTELSNWYTEMKSKVGKSMENVIENPTVTTEISENK
eukprot:GSMAST32.ASY1.ANO1.1059.1 assembled CDS